MGDYAIDKCQSQIQNAAATASSICFPMLTTDLPLISEI